jgi:hypothetical protein
VDAGVAVEFFPDDLARQIIAANRQFIAPHRRSGGLDDEIGTALLRLKSPTISSFSGIGCGDATSLQTCPHIRAGWALSRVHVSCANQNFRIPTELKVQYRDYLLEHKKQRRFQDNQDKFMLAANPASFTDMPSLSLALRPTKYSMVQFYLEKIAPDSTRRENLISELMQAPLSAHFPQALCMHMVVATLDGKLLLTKRSDKVRYHPGTWSASVEEQLARKDLGSSPYTVLPRLARRLLKEELALGKNAYHQSSIKLLSVFLEADILNTALCVFAELRLTSRQLNSVLRAKPREDYEFTDWDFIDLDRQTLLTCIFRPTRRYHPTSRYRLLLTLLHRVGVPTAKDVQEFP